MGTLQTTLISPKEMWICCLSLIKNNFGKKPINTFPVTKGTRGRREFGGGGQQIEGEEKSVRILTTFRNVCLFACDGLLGVIPMASYSSPDTATDCSDVLTLTKMADLHK